MFLTVYLSNSEKHFTEVPVTPETLCRDVVDVCKEPGETECYLAESWRGSGEDACENQSKEEERNDVLLVHEQAKMFIIQ
ncbi:apoptosis-stimulating of p53 protein 2b isoform X1 [Tachysurus ichikawai]